MGQWDCVCRRLYRSLNGCFLFHRSEIMDPAVDQAYRAMQTAERQKDQDPRAYREAKVKYYRLAQGEKWMQTERKRVLQEAKTHTRKWLSE